MTIDVCKSLLNWVCYQSSLVDRDRKWEQKISQTEVNMTDKYIRKAATETCIMTHKNLEILARGQSEVGCDEGWDSF